MAGQRGFAVAELLVAVLLVLLLGAIIVPNLNRGRMTRCEVDGPWIVRTLITDEIAYSTSFPDQGYAPNLSVLGGEEGCPGGPSAAHACLINNDLACPEGIGEEWCHYPGNGYWYNIQTGSHLAPHEDFWITATPRFELVAEEDDEWWRHFLSRPSPVKTRVLNNYCGADDGVPRMGTEGTLSMPLSKAECLALKSISTYDGSAGD